jgi:2-oxoisovalerate dehydrogenase E2 component (dihydrolipoyl transacylase)
MSEQIFLLPDVGEGLIEADIVEWKVKEGDMVTLNQPLCDVETAKATVELPSPYEGRIVKLHGKPGDTMEVHKPLVTIEVNDGVTTAATPAPPAAPTPAAEKPAGEGRQAVLIGYGVADESGVATRTHRRAQPAAPVAAATAAAPVVARASGPVRTTPPVRLLAKQKGIDLATIVGTGREGTVTRADVEKVIANGGAVSNGARATVAVATGPTSSSRFVGREIDSWSTGAREERIPVKGVLKAMAEAMVQSKSQQPHAGVWIKVDATKTMELVASLKQRESLQGVRISPLVVVSMALIDAIRHYPGLNSNFDSAAGEVVLKRYVNLGIAADTPRGLIVPNVKDADQMDLVSLARALNNLVDVARTGKTTPQDMAGGTVTITNVGPFGVDAVAPIIPPGTAAILGVGQIAKRPWVVNDELAVRQVVELSLFFDHRQVDGALASAALAHIGKFLTDPAAAIIAG